MKKFFLFTMIFTLICFTGVTIENEDNSYNEGFITSFEITGLKRTKISVVEKALSRFIGLKEAEIDQNMIHAAIVNTGVLEPLSIEIRDTEDNNSKVLFVDVAEKWSLFPIPMFTTNSNGYISGGLMIMYANAFGIADSTLIGGFYGNAGMSSVFLYNHNAQKKGLPDWSVFLIYELLERKITDQKDNIFHQWVAHSTQPILKFSYPFFDDTLKASFGLGYEGYFLTADKNDYFPPEKSVMGIIINPAISYEKNIYDGFFMVSRLVALEYKGRIGINSINTHTIEVKSKYEKSIFPGFKLCIQTAISYFDNNELFSLLRPSDFASILPRYYGTNTYFGGRMGLEKGLFRWKYIVPSVSLDYQLVGSKNPDLGWNFDHGPSVGIIFYLPRIAFPASAINFNYNVARNYFNIGYALGASF